MANLKTFYNMVFDGDAWGCSLQALFAIAGELHYRGFDTPEDWGYQPGAMGGDPRVVEDIWFSECETASPEELEHFGNVLSRYINILRRAGRDY